MIKDKSKIIIKIKDEEYKIDYISDISLLNQKIMSIIKEKYKITSNQCNKNLYKLFYFDEEDDKLPYIMQIMLHPPMKFYKEKQNFTC